MEDLKNIYINYKQAIDIKSEDLKNTNFVSNYNTLENKLNKLKNWFENRKNNIRLQKSDFKTFLDSYDWLDNPF